MSNYDWEDDEEWETVEDPDAFEGSYEVNTETGLIRIQEDPRALADRLGCTIPELEEHGYDLDDWNERTGYKKPNYKKKSYTSSSNSGLLKIKKDPVALANRLGCRVSELEDYGYDLDEWNNRTGYY